MNIPPALLEVQNRERERKRRRVLNVALGAAVATLVALCAYGSARLSERQGLQQLAESGAECLELYAAALEAEVARYASLPSLIAVDRDVAALLEQTDNPELRARAAQALARLNARAGSLSMAIMSADGAMLASSGARAQHIAASEPVSEVTDHFAASALDSSTEYHFVHEVPESVARIVVAVSLAPLEATWVDLGMRTRSERLMVIDEHGVVMMSSVPGWKFRTLVGTPPALQRPVGRYPAHAPAALPYTVDARLDTLGAQLVRAAERDGRLGPPRLAQEHVIVPLGVRLLSLSDMSDVKSAATAAAWGGGAAGATVGLLAVIVLNRRRGRLALRRAHSKLEMLVAERTHALLSANEELQRRIAERDLMEQELLQANKLAVLGQMSAGISHEINQPLTALRALSRNTMRLLEAGRTQGVCENLATIDDMVERMGRIVMQLKSFAHKSRPATDVVDLSCVVRNMLVLLEHRLRESRTQLVVNMTPQLLVRGDATRLEQVLVNLVANAVDAAEQGVTREVRIDAYPQDNRVVVAVSDTGPPVEEAVMQRMFEPFFTTKSAGQGLGLGLVISSKIVGELGGSLRPLRTAAGMRFEFDLAPAEDGHA